MKNKEPVKYFQMFVIGGATINILWDLRKREDAYFSISIGTNLTYFYKVQYVDITRF